MCEQQACTTGHCFFEGVFHERNSRGKFCFRTSSCHLLAGTPTGQPAGALAGVKLIASFSIREVLFHGPKLEGPCTVGEVFCHGPRLEGPCTGGGVGAVFLRTQPTPRQFKGVAGKGRN